MAYDPATPAGQVRLLINDTKEPFVFDEGDINGFLTLESSSIKRAAAQALDVIADDEVLTAKVVTTSGESTNGAAVADSLRKRAVTLREQAVYDLGLDDDESVFEVVSLQPDQTWWAV